MLGAYEPTIRNIIWSEKTHILAVLVEGYHRQAVAGLEKHTPLVISSYDNKGPCGYFNVDPENFAPFKNGKVMIGDSITTRTRLVTSYE